MNWPLQDKPHKAAQAGAGGRETLPPRGWKKHFQEEENKRKALLRQRDTDVLVPVWKDATCNRGRRTQDDNGLLLTCDVSFIQETREAHAW